MIEYGGKFTKTTHLSIFHHFICISIGSLSLLQGLLIKYIPLKIFKWMTFKRMIDFTEIESDSDEETLQIYEGPNLE